MPLVPLKAAAGAFSDPQHVEDDNWEWVTVDAKRRLRPGMFVAQVVGKSMEPAILKRCTRSLSKPQSYEETRRCRFDPALEPMPTEAIHLSPPCCVSTHRSRVVDPDGPTTFLDHREALFGRLQRTSLTQRSGHLERFPVESS